MNAVDQKTEDRIRALELAYQESKDRQIEILGILRPIAESYAAATRVGKWFMAFLVFVSILLGVVLAIKNIFK